MENTNNRPLILELEDAKNELINCANNILHGHGLPCYLIEPIFGELYAQIKNAAKNELDAARAQMEKGAE